MAHWTEERIAFGLGLLGGLVFLLAAFLALIIGSVDLASDRLNGTLAAGSQALLLAALGALGGLFAYLGYHEWRDRPFSAALLLILVAVIGVMIGGPGTGALPLVGAMLVGLAGILYLLEPMKRAARYVTTA